MTTREAMPAAIDIKQVLGADPDFLRPMVQALVQEALEAEMTAALGAGKGERSATRLGYRSGYYERGLVTRVGKLELRVPQDRDGRFSTELFERYQRSEKALVAALVEMYVQGVSTRKVKAQDRGGDRGAVRPQLLRLRHQPHQQASRCRARPLRYTQARRGLPLPDPRCPRSLPCGGLRPTGGRRSARTASSCAVLPSLPTDRSMRFVRPMTTLKLRSRLNKRLLTSNRLSCTCSADI
jgi:hypothetical protein